MTQITKPDKLLLLLSCNLIGAFTAGHSRGRFDFSEIRKRRSQSCLLCRTSFRRSTRNGQPLSTHRNVPICFSFSLFLFLFFSLINPCSDHNSRSHRHTSHVSPAVVVRTTKQSRNTIKHHISPRNTVSRVPVHMARLACHSAASKPLRTYRFVPGALMPPGVLVGRRFESRCESRGILTRL